ncbi:methyltransferase domain-containing protein [Lichenicola cladoniae]|uniref:Methyltransferase domain-containing protein n=1 Tax=Lichenicola cladoniae TaxID=1484109 RepID=A0A6M8HNU3_9PROT|nr:methyltransferase domain-containing protein [Lichenicola cladoniae]NPD67512.1 methyltransferase domain-containing protein [Acetobacteraceae bacterium]QKE89965.1 methyltransferase domain-containing protein [Lichenicola cladoniae]
MAGRFAHRVMLPELMDDASCGPDEFRRCLVDLAKVNRLTLATRPTLHFLKHAVRRLPAGRALRILDVGGGYGDALRDIDRWAARRGIALDMTSVDLSPWARNAGEAAPPTRQAIRWVTADIFDYRPEQPPDVVLSSLFTHHLDDASVVRFLGWMEQQATLGWFVNDLQRHWLPYYGFKLWSRAAGWHRFVQHDGPVSFGRAFIVPEWRMLLGQAGLPPDAATIRWWLPFRVCVSRFKPPAQ